VNRSALSLFALVLALLVPAVPLGIGLEPAFDLVGFHLFAVALATAGLLVASRHPSNPVGWLFLGLAVVQGLAELFQAYGARAEQHGLPAGEVAVWVTTWIWILTDALLALVLLRFPDGRLPSRRWRIVPMLAFAGCALAIPGQALSPRIGEAFTGGRNPVAVQGPATDVLFGLGTALVMAALLASAVSLFFRFRRARGVERQQLKWVVLAASFLGVAAPVASVFWTQTILAELLIAFALALIPTAAAIAILRYRLYDIDVVINRTLVYGALTATLAGAYLGSVLVLQLALSGLTAGSSLAVAASTLGVAALFRPARARIQEAVDRRFFRRKYDAARTLEAFSARLRDEVALDSLSAELRGVVAQTMQPAHVSVWLRKADL
jgi:hypothetical protein